MMNGGGGGGAGAGGGGPGVQPTTPAHPGRREHEMPYSPQHSHHGPYPPQPYNQHAPHPNQHYRQPYYQQHPPPQWSYYHQNAGPMHRPGYPHQYPQHMMGAPYQVPQVPMSMSPRPGYHIPQHSPVRPHHIYSPPPNDRLAYQIPPNPTHFPQSFVPAPPTRFIPFYPSLPWYSDSSQPFPAAASKRRRRPAPQSPSRPVILPARGSSTQSQSDETPVAQDGEQLQEAEQSQQLPQQDVVSEVEASMIASEEATLSVEQIQDIQQPTTPIHPILAAVDTPATSQAPSEANSTQPTTPSSTQPPRSAGSTSTVRPGSKLLPVVPVVPHIPGLSKNRRKESVSTVGETAQPAVTAEVDTTSGIDEATSVSTPAETSEATPEAEAQQPIVKVAPKSWADLVKSKASAGQSQTIIATDTNLGQSNGTPAKGALAEIIKKFSVQQPDEDNKLSFIKPKGLINTGNMCYMNAVLQVLLYCTPFYGFLDMVSKNAAYSFKSDTPMVDAMILFFREFPVIDAAGSAEQLRRRLKNEELEQYGEPFTPEFVYEVIRRLPRFASMRRGHQQDAEEFLGFLLEEMHEECARTSKASNGLGLSDDLLSPVTDASQAEDGWHEVGPKQRAAVTRTSGWSTAESPITKIFGGNLRSEFRVPGTKNSVTFEPYQPLQLDIGSPQVNNIVDALKGLTRSETIHGDFNSPRGPGVSATKQVFIETLPPVLILHLKRFQYDNTGGTQKIWKKVGYPLELEIPKEVFPQHKRGGFAVKGGLPRYKLISVVYHHGKSATGGHYTVDVRRQDGAEWIRLDDTIIRRVRSEDVAEGGSEEDPKILAAALEQHKRDQSSSSNIFDQVREEQEESENAEKGWSHVNGSSHGGSAAKKWSGVVNGTATPVLSSGKRSPVNKSSVKDNKVAYILFYQRIKA